MEAEYTAPSVVVTQMIGLRELLGEFGMKCDEPMVLYVDNQAVLKHLGGDGGSARSKHVDVRIKFVSSHTKSGILEPRYLESCFMPANLMTKAVPAPRLEELKFPVGLKQDSSETESEQLS